MTKPILKRIDGILLLDKPMYITSNDALQRVKRLFGAKKAGHTGILDPRATGMLPICFGEATKFSQYLLESDKCYQVTAKLGVKTRTGDTEGEVIEIRPVTGITQEQIEEVLRQFEGPIQQVPPMYSALKIQGKSLYELARQGIQIPREARAVNIYKLQLIEFQGDTLQLEVQCSKGTYVRTLVEDIGELLKCGAHVSALRRSVVLPYNEIKMYTLATLEDVHKQFGMDALAQYLLPLETSVQNLPAVKLSNAAAFYMKMGQSVMVPHFPAQGLVRIYSCHDEFMGVGEILEDGRVAPRRLVAMPQKMAEAV
ncbi:MAG: truB [Gammaproteobacteria bacterium]|jgi:tRNA pseudouridine55 synthase|nr:truB [Gammaproteobacteria bacterium]